MLTPDTKYTEDIGVKSESLIFAQPDTGEEAFYIIIEFVKTGAFDLIVVDSVAALTPDLKIEVFQVSRLKRCQNRSLSSFQKLIRLRPSSIKPVQP
ncbi:RecA protein [Lactococcus lactis subsp. lactis]|uniref:Protein RecA n=1 Tax=Lactococcus lactis subsp. lactis TaxID=1360 RepID=A0A0V8DLG3_LACLL|nr:hypothetical protein [Lactococcus lactis]KSU14319.1 RecA protein [Lactococcus lactis subsp. lactis]